MSESGKNEVDWVREYKAKEELMRERKILEVCPKEFYRELFPKGSLQSTERDGKGNVIATQIRPSGRGRTRQWIVDDSLQMLDKVIGDEFGLVPPIAFYGKTHKNCTIRIQKWMRSVLSLFVSAMKRKSSCFRDGKMGRT